MIARIISNDLVNIKIPLESGKEISIAFDDNLGQRTELNRTEAIVFNDKDSMEIIESINCITAKELAILIIKHS